MGAEFSPEQLSVVAFDVTDMESWIAELGRPLSDEEQSFVDGVRRGLEDVGAGRTISDEELTEYLAERRRQFLAARG